MTHYNEEMTQLKESLLAMASHAESALTRAMRALVERDDLLAQSVIDDDSIVDQFEVEIDDIAIHLLAKAPVATDLRLTTAAMKISPEPGARRRLRGDDRPARDRPRHGTAAQALRRPAAHGDDVARDAAGRHFGVHQPRARQGAGGRSADLEVDNLNRQLHRELSSFMIERPATISRC